ncbi:hypothetical protein RchiOBHm_Chr6g0273191 [Rosa chinensis]|uniref:Uncharacterized protein n=1 Tax=Rosa chinensis TaxID=74649 RepID=A0A2P6PRF1_ROSCH|nr:hypothetical protein RchiOBHm_Chr6g0273191 [Rosa chinensis]
MYTSFSFSFSFFKLGIVHHEAYPKYPPVPTPGLEVWSRDYGLFQRIILQSLLLLLSLSAALPFSTSIRDQVVSTSLTLPLQFGAMNSIML